MVEVTLAIATVGIGIAGVMAMFPVAIKSSRDAVAQNYCADGVDQFITIMNTLAVHDTDWTNSSSYIYKIANATPVGGMPSTLPGLISSPLVFGNICFPKTGSDPDFTTKTAMMAMGKLDSNGNVDPTLSDFTAGIRYWLTPIDGLYIAGQTFNFSSAAAADRYKYGVTLHVEVSWPIAAPDNMREKRYYSYEIFNVRY